MFAKTLATSPSPKGLMLAKSKLKKIGVDLDPSATYVSLPLSGRAFVTYELDPTQPMPESVRRAIQTQKELAQKRAALKEELRQEILDEINNDRAEQVSATVPPSLPE